MIHLNWLSSEISTATLTLLEGALSNNFISFISPLPNKFTEAVNCIAFKLYNSFLASAIPATAPVIGVVSGSKKRLYLTCDFSIISSIVYFFVTVGLKVISAHACPW